MSDDNNIVDLSKERERRDSKELDENSNEFNPWQDMDSSINSRLTDHPGLPESPFLVLLRRNLIKSFEYIPADVL